MCGVRELVLVRSPLGSNTCVVGGGTGDNYRTTADTKLSHEVRKNSEKAHIFEKLRVDGTLKFHNIFLSMLRCIFRELFL